MNRRSALKAFAGGTSGLLAGPGPLAAAQSAARRGLPPLKITDVKVVLTQPGPDHLVIVKVLTSEPGLYGLGCATHRERPLAVAAAVEQYLKPFVIGRNCDEIEDIWQAAYVSSYFRSGVTLNNSSAASTAPSGTSSASAPACRSINCSAAASAPPSRSTATPAPASSPTSKTRSASGCRRATVTCACNWPSPATPATA